MTKYLKKDFTVETKNQYLMGTVEFEVYREGDSVKFDVIDVHVDAMECKGSGEAHKRCDIVTDHGWCRRHSVSPQRGAWFELVDSIAQTKIDFLEILTC